MVVSLDSTCTIDTRPGERLHFAMERSTMLCSWENPLFRLGHFQLLCNRSPEGTCYVYIHTIVIFQPADFGQRMSRASNSVVYARALWRSIRDSKSLGEGPDRSSIAVPTAIEKACCSYAHRCCN